MSEPLSRTPTFHRTISHALRLAQEREESENLLGDDDTPTDHAGCVVSGSTASPNLHFHLPVYKNIHRSVHKWSSREHNTLTDFTAFAV
jgi:hypothetical protein